MLPMPRDAKLTLPTRPVTEEASTLAFFPHNMHSDIMSPCQEMNDSSACYNASQDSGNASILRQDSLAYSVSDAGSYAFEDFSDESFEMYCDRMNSKEVVVIFENGIHPSQQEQYQVNHHHHEQQQQQQQVAAVDTMTQRVQALATRSTRVDHQEYCVHVRQESSMAVSSTLFQQGK